MLDTLTGIPGGEVVVLVRGTNGPALSLDSDESRLGFSHVNDIVMKSWDACPIDGSARLEDPRSNRVTLFNPTTLDISLNVVRAGAITQ